MLRSVPSRAGPVAGAGCERWRKERFPKRCWGAAVPGDCPSAPRAERFGERVSRCGAVTAGVRGAGDATAGSGDFTVLREVRWHQVNPRFGEPGWRHHIVLEGAVVMSEVFQSTRCFLYLCLLSPKADSFMSGGTTSRYPLYSRAAVQMRFVKQHMIALS